MWRLAIYSLLLQAVIAPAVIIVPIRPAGPPCGDNCPPMPKELWYILIGMGVVLVILCILACFTSIDCEKKEENDALVEIVTPPDYGATSFAHRAHTVG